MATNRFTTLGVGVLLALLEIGSCHRCYVCTSARDISCADPYKKSDKHSQMCILDGLCGKSIVGTPDGDVVARQCFDPLVNCETIDIMTNKHSTDEKVKLCSSCDGDLCNGGTTVSSSIFHSILVVFVTCLYY